MGHGLSLILACSMVSACWGWTGWVFVLVACGSLIAATVPACGRSDARRETNQRACVSCGCVCRVRTSRGRTVVHVPLGSDAIHLKVRVCTYECVTCARMWHDDLKALVSGRTLLSRAAVDWALRRVALGSASISACARTLGCSWNALDRAVRAHGMRILSRSDPYAQVTRIGVDEHVWRHGAFGDRYVTVIVDLTPRADGAPARLLDMVPGRCTRAFANWLEARGARFRDRVEVVAMDGVLRLEANHLATHPTPTVLLQCLFSRLISIFPQCGQMVFPGLVIMQSVM